MGYKEYVERYAGHHCITVDEAEKHKMVHEAKAYYEELEEQEAEKDEP
jgi:hypothetical protein